MLLYLVVDTAIVKLESTKCRLSIIMVFIKLVRSVTFSRASRILKLVMVSCLFSLVEYTMSQTQSIVDW
jgi:hypothetical protein